MIKCENIDHFQSWSVMNTDDIICIFLSNLPGSVRDKCYWKVLILRTWASRELEVADFIQFVNEKTLIVTHPMFSQEAVEQYVEKKPSYKKKIFQHLQL